VVNFCWFFFKWGILLALVAVIVGVALFYNRVDEQIRRAIEQRFAEHYTDLQVSVRSAELVEGEGIRVRGLSIVEPGAEGPRAELLHVEEVFLACATDLERLIRQDVKIGEVRCRRPTLRVTRRPDDTWSVSRLLPPPVFGPHPPEIVIENGSIEIFDPLKHPASTITFRDVAMHFGVVDDPDAPPRTRSVRGCMTGDHVRRIELSGTINLSHELLHVEGRAEGLDISPALRRAAPEPLASKFEPLGAFRGESDFSFRLWSEPESETPWRYEVTGRVLRGRMDDPRLPHAITDIRANLRLSNEGYAVRDLVGRSGQSSLRLSCCGAAFGAGNPMVVEAEVRNLELDRQLADVLPESLRDHWHKLLPAGQIHANMHLTYDGVRWNPRVFVQCLDVSFSYHKFPYRLDQGEGTLDLKDGELNIDMTAASGNQPIRLSGQLRNLEGDPTGWFEAKGEAVPLDDKLLIALAPEPREVVRSLNASGTLDFYVRLWRDQPNAPLQRHLLIGLNRCAMQYKKFPYPISNISGTIELLDGTWSFHNLEGTNDTGYVRCRGKLRRTSEGQSLDLVLEANDVPLEKELRDALRPDMQELWEALNPRGAVDLSAQIGYLADKRRLSVVVRAEPQEAATSIEPAAFPYQLNRLRGVLTYRNGRVTIERFKAEHGRARMTANGHCDFQPDGSWHFHLEDISVERLRLDRELIQALPGRLRKSVVQLNPSGPINLRGTWDLFRQGREPAPCQSQWDVTLGFHQAAIDCGVKLENLHGSLDLQGEFDGQQFQSRGELAVDSLTYRDMQFTQVMGPIWIDDSRVLLGRWVDRRHVGPQPKVQRARATAGSRAITARFCGGTVYGDGWINMGPVPRYGFRAHLTNADLALCAQELMAGRQELRGTAMATVDLRGTGTSLNSLGGRGRIRLRDADIYELPLMISLLKILSIRQPDPTAFSKSDIEFRIEGNHVYFDRIDFNGDAISLLGKGEMDFRSNIRLTFHAVVGRDEIKLPVIRDLVGGASQNIMLLHVDGTLQHPKTTREAFPGVSQALQQLQGDLQEQPAPPSPQPQASKWLPWFGDGPTR
jgi:hypothetical protein